MSKIYVIDFDPKHVKILPKIIGQSETLPDGTIRAQFTKAQLEDVSNLVSLILDGESNEFVAQGEMEYALPDF